MLGANITIRSHSRVGVVKKCPSLFVAALSLFLLAIVPPALPQQRQDDVQQGTTLVPNLNGLTLEQAGELLRRSGLQLGNVQQGTAHARAGTIYSQDPKPTMRVRAHTRVNIWLAKPPSPVRAPREVYRPPPQVIEGQPSMVLVPNLIGHTTAEAKAMLQGQDHSQLQLGRVIEREFAHAKPGRIYDQDPKPSREVRPGTYVNVWVAKPQTVRPAPVYPPSEAPPTLQPRGPLVPNLVGRTTTEAEAMLRGLNLQLGRIREVEAPNTKSGTIYAQNPEPETKVRPRTAVNVWVAKAPQVPVPNLVGHSFDEAQNLLEPNLRLGRVMKKQSANFKENTILDQRPLADTLVPVGTAVEVQIAVTPIVPVPDLVGHASREAQGLLEPNLRLGQVTKTESRTATEDTILEQKPPPGSKVPLNTPVDIAIAIPPMVPVPNLVGRPIQTAGQLLSPDLHLGQVTETKTSSAKEGVIVGQNPTGGAQVRAGRGVDVQVAVTPKVNVPNLVGKELSQANAILAGKGLRVGNVAQKTSEGEPAKVLTQDPTSGAEVTVGTAVDLVVSETLPTLLIDTDHSSQASGKPVAFHASLQPELPGAQYQFFFGDGTASDWLNQSAATHAYSEPGDYSAHAVARLKGNEFPSGTIVLHVLQVSLVPTTRRAGLDETIHFTALMKPATQGVEYRFVFDDGSETRWGGAQTADHPFRQAGSHHAQVFARVPSGEIVASDLANFDVVQAGAPTPPPHPPWWVVLGGILAILGVTSIAIWHFWPPKPGIAVRTGPSNVELQLASPSDLGFEVRLRAVRSPGEQIVVLENPAGPQEEAAHD
jgi:beta-lactam-binding protein with PASTA domain